MPPSNSVSTFRRSAAVSNKTVARPRSRDVHGVLVGVIVRELALCRSTPFHAWVRHVAGQRFSASTKIFCARAASA